MNVAESARGYGNKMHRESIVRAYSTMIEERIDDRWEPVLLTFMFNQLTPDLGPRRDVMQKAVVEAYSRSLTRMFRRPRTMHTSALPLWIASPDHPVPKHDRKPLRDVKVNDGEHFHALCAIPPHTRLGTSYVEHIQGDDGYQRIYSGREKMLWRLHAEAIVETPAEVGRYALKMLERGRVSFDDIMVLPRSRSEL